VCDVKVQDIQVQVMTTDSRICERKLIGDVRVWDIQVSVVKTELRIYKNRF
jgi:hypothetical protein